mgnify:CR=1 FL=1
MKHQIQEQHVKNDHYKNMTYSSKGRFASYWHQIYDVTSLNPDTILEIGIGNGFFYNFIKQNFNVNIHSLDVNPGLNPDHIGSVTNIPIYDKMYDCVACFQVLEHLTFDNFEAAIAEMKRLTRKWIVLSLPDRNRFVGFKIHRKSFPIKKREFKINIPYLKPNTLKFKGEHYWEIGAKGYPLKKIKSIFINSDLKIIRTYRVFEHPIHRFFILEK